MFDVFSDTEERKAKAKDAARDRRVQENNNLVVNIPNK